MVAARMISREELDAALSEVPNLAGLARKVEQTMEVPPPEEKPPAEAPDGGPAVLESPPASKQGSEPEEAPPPETPAPLPAIPPLR
jgi:hypothetical protein